MLTRRDWLRTTAAAGAAVTLSPDILAALARQEMMTRAIPSTGERVPIVGLGSSATFQSVARGDDVTQLRNVLSALVENGGTVFDTAPSYGTSEEVAGRLADELEITDRIFWATKVNVARRGGGADPARARAQIEASFEYFGVDEIELMQVHNLGDLPVQMPIIQELKAEGRIRYIGTTLTPRPGPQYEGLLQAMRDYPLDFIGVDYAVDNTDAADEVLPLAQERGIGVLVYLPFGRTRLWNRVGDREVPDWAREFGANSWAQFFIKFAAAHPAVTCVTPATSNPEHMVDNLGAGLGRMPNRDEQQRMVEYVDALPSAG